MQHTRSPLTSAEVPHTGHTKGLLHAMQGWGASRSQPLPAGRASCWEEHNCVQKGPYELLFYRSRCSGDGGMRGRVRHTLGCKTSCTRNAPLAQQHPCGVVGHSIAAIDRMQAAPFYCFMPGRHEMRLYLRRRPGRCSAAAWARARPSTSVAPAQASSTFIVTQCLYAHDGAPDRLQPQRM